MIGGSGSTSRAEAPDRIDLGAEAPPKKEDEPEDDEDEEEVEEEDLSSSFLAFMNILKACMSALLNVIVVSLVSVFLAFLLVFGAFPRLGAFPRFRLDCPMFVSKKCLQIQ